MIKDVLESIRSAAIKLFANRGALAMSLALYAALLAVIYVFFAVVKEATMLEVWLTVVILPAAATMLFFSLQVMGLSYSRADAGGVALLKRASRDWWKLWLVSLPLFFLGWLVIRFLRFPAAKPPAAQTAVTPPVVTAIADGAWYLLICFALPLLAIHLWIAATRRGVKEAIKEIRQITRAAFSPRSILIYLTVAVVFGVIAYLLFFNRLPVGSEWLELWLFAGRLILAFLTVFVGWLIMLGAMIELSDSPVSDDRTIDETP